MIQTPVLQWFNIYDNIITLTSYLADHGYSADDIAYCVEKPWKFEDEFNAARKELDEQLAAEA